MQWNDREPQWYRKKYRPWYIRTWQDFPLTFGAMHVIVIGLLVFLLTVQDFHNGQCHWFFPATGLAVAFLACLALFVTVRYEDGSF